MLVRVGVGNGIGVGVRVGNGVGMDVGLGVARHRAYRKPLDRIFNKAVDLG